MEKNNNKMIMIGVLVAIALVVGGFFVFNSDDDTTDDAVTESTQNETNSTTNQEPESVVESQSTIVELAQATESLSTLVAAVVEADLVDTLNSDGPFTVFAPTNDAFASLLATLDITAEELLARDDLADILTYHVVAGKVVAADFGNGQVVETVQGGELKVSVSSNGVTLTDANGNVAKVVSTDINASNGVVHVIDAVVLP